MDTEPMATEVLDGGWSERLAELALGAAVVTAFLATAVMVALHPTPVAAAGSVSAEQQRSAVRAAVGPGVAPPLPRVLLMPVDEAVSVLEEAGATVQVHAAGDGTAGADWWICQAAELPGGRAHDREVTLLAAPGGTPCP